MAALPAQLIERAIFIRKIAVKQNTPLFATLVVEYRAATGTFGTACEAFADGRSPRLAGVRIVRPERLIAHRAAPEIGASVAGLVVLARLRGRLRRFGQVYNADPARIGRFRAHWVLLFGTEHSVRSPPVPVHAEVETGRETLPARLI